MSHVRIPFFRHDLGAPEVDAFASALAGSILTTGDVVAEFERRFAAQLGSPHAVGVTSCTAALHLALLGLGIGPGDEVITTPLTFVATATAILQAGARPVFVDVEPDTGNLDVSRVEGALTPRTRAILPVHLFGQMCDMRALRAVADRHGLVVIEDAAHCLEGERDGVRPGMLSEAACFSFYATKSITSGEGGALIARDAGLAERVRVLRQQGLTWGAAERERRGYRRRDVEVLGWKYNMSNLQAAILLPQLGRVAGNHARRTALVARYREGLADLPAVRAPVIRSGATHAWHLCTVRLPDAVRDAVIGRLERDGVAVAVHYDPPVHLTAYFRRAFGYAAGAFPAAEAIAATTLSLPLYPAMPPAHADEVVRRLGAAMGAR